jgi:DNA replication and repair protein RecF
VYLTHLSVSNFRKISRLDKAIPRGALLLVGGNAQGKTSLLEAIYFLATMASFRADHDRELLDFTLEKEPLVVARLTAEYHRGGKKHTLEVRLIREMTPLNGSSRMRKEVLLDRAECKLRAAIGQIAAVFFSPQLMSVIEGAPEERRRYLNLMISQVSPHYVSALADYTHALAQRNALLKQLAESNGDQTQLDFWDEQLTLFGSQLMYERVRAVQDLRQLAASIHRKLTPNKAVLRLVYQPAYQMPEETVPAPLGQYALPITASADQRRLSVEELRQGFQMQLDLRRREEIARGVTTLGPHRDELRFLEDGIDLGTYGSRGQARTALLSLKLAEVFWMKQKIGEWPVLLLDEVLAELDIQRRADLLEQLAESEQTILATTDLAMFSSQFVQKATVWEVQEGNVSEGKIP